MGNRFVCGSFGLREVGSRKKANPDTTHDTAIYADQLTPSQPPQLIGSPMAVPDVSCLGKGKNPWISMDAR